MDLGLTEGQEILKTTVSDFVQQEFDKDTLIELEMTPTGVTPELFRKVAELGWLGVLIPETYGGEGRSFTDAAVLFEELGRGPVSGPYFSSAVLGALTVLHGGTEEQKQTILPVLARQQSEPVKGLHFFGRGQKPVAPEGRGSPPAWRRCEPRSEKPWLVLGALSDR